MAQVETPSPYPESPMDQEDMIYPCKGCGEILEEGKAFELAGNRWHIDCFRCNTCGTLLDSDANLLLLGDGSLICNNCTYSCSACGNKIEDLAILTGEQAFCSACFRCRNCKKKIENLRYARTSQGIFCMSCHEALMARRRKRSKTTPKQSANGSVSAKEKALPSLPPGALPESAFEAETPPTDSHSGTPAARSPPERHYGERNRGHSNKKRDVSPLSDDAQRDGPTLPASTYGDPRSSNVSRDSDDGEERGILTMQFDPNPAPGPPPIARKEVPRSLDHHPPVHNETRPRDYFSRMGNKSTGRDVLREELRPASSRSASADRDPERTGSQAKSSPHILYQDKGRHKKRETSGSNTSASGSAVASPALPNVQERGERTIPQQLENGSQTSNQNEGFKLQEVPKSKKDRSRSVSKVDGKSPALASPAGVSPINTNVENTRADKLVSQSPMSVDSHGSSINPFDDPKRKEGGSVGATSAPPKQAERPTRGDSLTPATRKAKTPTPDLQTPITATMQPLPERKGSTSSIPSVFADAKSTLSRENSRSKPTDSLAPARSSFDAPPPRASSRPSASSKAVVEDEFSAPRAPPPPPPASAGHKKEASISAMHSYEVRANAPVSPALRSSALPKHSMDAPFSMEEEMARIIRGDSKRSDGAPASVLRKVSNAVKHGRSFSDRGLHSAGKSSSNGGLEISSPMTISSPLLYSPTGKDNNESLSAQLKRAQQRIAELESELNRLEETVDSSAEIRAANNELREKRTTIVVLDTQREMVVRELEVMTEHLSRAKDSNQPLDLTSLKTEVLKDFAESLQKLKDQMSAQIEDLMHKRNQLTEEIGNLIQMKDKGFQEYESLSNKNAQLQEMNNQILHNIQEMYRSNRAPNASAPTANGLGIYHPGARTDAGGSADIRSLNMVNTDGSMPNLLHETEAEPATVLTAPQVVNIRKGQPKKFNWRKGGEKMAKNVTKGIKGAFAGDRPGAKDGEAPYSIGMPYNQSHQAVGGGEQSSLGGSRTALDANRPGAPFGLFAQKNGARGPGTMKDNSSSNLAADASVLFGSELEARCEYEKRVIPSIVSRCIEEVESRGIDMEGIYRKSGGAGQVKIVQQGFEKDGNYDISDPDLDIHAVTSALKQYFRKLPTPLITYDAYEGLLEAAGLQDKEKQSAALRLAVAELPEHHRDCLEFLIQHLARVMARESENLMTPLNLSVVFAPTIMRPESIEREMSDMQAQRTAVAALLENNKTIFPDE